MIRIARRFASYTALFAVVTVLGGMTASRADENADLMAFILAEQGKRLETLLEEFENCSYTVTTAGHDMVTLGGLPYHTVSKVVRAGSNLFVAKEGLTVATFEDSDAVEQWPVASRFIANDAWVADWYNLSYPMALMYFKNEWEAAGATPKLDKLVADMAGPDPRRLAYCTGSNGDRSLADLVQASANTGFSWVVEPESLEDGVPTAFIVRRFGPEQSRPDLTVRVDAAKGFVITESVFAPYRQPDAYTRTARKQYQNVGGKWVLRRIEETATSDDYDGPLNRHVDEFADFRELEPADTDKFTLASMEFPSRMLISKRMPPQGTGDETSIFMELKGDTLTAVDDEGRVLVEMGIILRR